MKKKLGSEPLDGSCYNVTMTCQDNVFHLPMFLIQFADFLGEGSDSQNPLGRSRMTRFF